MAGIIPIPTTRVGDLFVRQRLVGQVQHDQLALFRLQNQISTGQRLQLPSDDAPAALRAINLQRLLGSQGADPDQSAGEQLVSWARPSTSIGACLERADRAARRGGRRRRHAGYARRQRQAVAQ